MKRKINNFPSKNNTSLRHVLQSNNRPQKFVIMNMNCLIQYFLLCKDQKGAKPQYCFLQLLPCFLVFRKSLYNNYCPFSFVSLLYLYF